MFGCLSLIGRTSAEVTSHQKSRAASWQPMGRSLSSCPQGITMEAGQ